MLKFRLQRHVTVFIFANTEKAQKSSEQQFLLVENRPTTRIGITINNIFERTFRIVTIVPLYSLRSNSENLEGYWEVFTTLPE